MSRMDFLGGVRIPSVAGAIAVLVHGVKDTPGEYLARVGSAAARTLRASSCSCAAGNRV